MPVLGRRLSICECTSFPFGFESRMVDLIVLFPDYRLPFYSQSFAYTIMPSFSGHEPKVF